MEMINQAAFDLQVEKGMKVVIFGAPWCPDCVRINPIIEVLQKEYQGKVEFLKFDIQEQEELKDALGIKRIPTLLFFKDGVEVLERLVEPDNKLSIQQVIEQLLS